MVEVKDFEITFAQSARDCRVKINGEPMRVTRCVITADIHDIPTKIELHYYGATGGPKVVTGYGPRVGPIILTGQMYVADEADGERHPAVRHDGSMVLHSCGQQVEEVTHFESPNKQYRCLTCASA